MLKIGYLWIVVQGLFEAAFTILFAQQLMKLYCLLDYQKIMVYNVVQI